MATSNNSTQKFLGGQTITRRGPGVTGPVGTNPADVYNSKEIQCAASGFVAGSRVQNCSKPMPPRNAETRRPTELRGSLSRDPSVAR